MLPLSYHKRQWQWLNDAQNWLIFQNIIKSMSVFRCNFELVKFAAILALLFDYCIPRWRTFKCIQTCSRHQMTAMREIVIRNTYQIDVDAIDLHQILSKYREKYLIFDLQTTKKVTHTSIERHKKREGKKIEWITMLIITSVRTGTAKISLDNSPVDNGKINIQHSHSKTEFRCRIFAYKSEIINWIDNIQCTNLHHYPNFNIDRFHWMAIRIITIHFICILLYCRENII